MFRKVTKILLFFMLLGSVFMGGFLLHRWLTPFERTSVQAPVQTFTWKEKSKPIPGYIVPPVELVKALPLHLKGWELQENPYASIFQFEGNVFSMARVAFIRDTSVLSIKISDLPLNSSLAQSLKTASTFQEESTVHFRKGFETEFGYGYEAYYKDENRGEIQVLAYERFWINIEGYNLHGPSSLRTAFQHILVHRLYQFNQKYPLPSRIQKK